MDSFDSSGGLQDRINRMNAWRDQQRREDEEFIRKQKIRMFINDCDEIRPSLRNHLLKDSKLCQLEQMKDNQKRELMMKDLDEAWHEVQSRDYQQGTERERVLAQCRWRYNQSVQDSLKDQMADKKERSLRVCEEINDERKKFAQICKEDYEMEQERLRHEQTLRKTIGREITGQMRENYERRKLQLERELKLDQIINDQIRRDLEKDQNAERCEKEQFRRGVFSYLDDLTMTRHHNRNVENEKEKLIEDIRVKLADDDWQRSCEFKHKRLLVNQIARVGQVQQIKRNERLTFEEAVKEKEDNKVFNLREMMERQSIKEAQWQQRLKAFRYGRELMEQRKAEELRDMAEKQKLNDMLLLAAQERERHEAMGQEFVKSYQDVLPLHPNLIIIQKGKKY